MATASLASRDHPWWQTLSSKSSIDVVAAKRLMPLMPRLRSARDGVVVAMSRNEPKFQSVTIGSGAFLNAKSGPGRSRARGLSISAKSDHRPCFTHRSFPMTQQKRGRPGSYLTTLHIGGNLTELAAVACYKRRASCRVGSIRTAAQHYRAAGRDRSEGCIQQNMRGWVIAINGSGIAGMYELHNFQRLKN
jgi:hypothetical protein